MPSTNTDSFAVPTDSLLRPSEVALALAVDEHTLAVWRCAEEGPRHLPFVKIGGAVRYRKSDVDAFVASGLHGAHSVQECI